MVHTTLIKGYNWNKVIIVVLKIKSDNYIKYFLQIWQWLYDRGTIINELLTLGKDFENLEWENKGVNC